MQKPPAGHGSDGWFVLFDLGGVLVDVEPKRSLEAWTNRGLKAASFEAAFMGSGAKPGGDLGDHDDEGMRRLVQEVAGRPLSARDMDDIWGAMVRWRPWVSGLLPRLRVPYGVLSTIDPIHARILGSLPGAQFHAFSCEDRVAKPAPEAFQLAVARCPVPPERIRYLDDRKENVAVARTEGLDAYLVSSQEQVHAALGNLVSEQ